jgi:uncharacterized protein YcbX
LFISGLNVYPVKSCRGIALDRALLTPTGIAFDREWMVVEPDGEFVTQRELPRMAMIETRLGSDHLELIAPGMPPLTVALAARADGRNSLQVRVWRDHVAALDEGDAAAYWLSELLRIPLRLARFAPATRRLSNKAFTGEFDSEAKFADGYALLVIAEASLADLNRRLAAKSLAALPMNRFRPNIVIAGDDAGPYDEDRMLWLRGKDIALKPVKACIRCQITGTDQATAATSAEPLLTLATYRVNAELGGPAFGQNAIVVQGVGRILQTGMQLEAEWNF